MEKTTVTEITKKAAINCQGDTNQYLNHIQTLFASIVENFKNPESKKTEIESINRQIKELESQNNLKRDTLSKLKSEKDSLSLELDELEKGNVNKPIFHFVIVTGLVMMLTAFLWIYYSAAVYGSINDMRRASDPFSASLNALEYLFPPMGFSSWFILLAPALFISIGYIIHYSKDKRTAYLFLFITFLVDCILCYLLTMKVEIANFGRMDFTFIKPFQRLDFYLFLFMGFIAYLIWGKLMNESIKTYELFRPATQKLFLIKKIKEIENELAKNAESINNDELNRLKNRLDAIELGKVFIQKHDLDNYLSWSATAWDSYLRFMTKSDNEIVNANKVIESITEQFKNEKYINTPVNIVFE